MLQEMMLGEEYQLIAGTSTILSPPTIVSVTARTAGSNETAIGANANYSVYVTAVNYFGETTISANSVVSGGTAAGQVVDVVIGPSAGGLTYNIYVSTNASPSRANAWLQAGSTTQSGVTTAGSQQASPAGGVKFTLQGTAPTATANAPSADTGTGKNTRMEGVIPVLSGHSATGGVYPSGWQGGYVNQSVGTHLSYNAIYTALDSLWESGSNSPGAFKADPQEIVGDGGDIMRLSNDVISAGTATNYRLFLEQQEVGGMRVGGAVSEFQNPVTRSILKMVVHPWFTQGTAAFMTYQPPMTYSQVANAWEMRCVQDYASIAWPVIDATFRFSIFLYGALIASAPMYSGLFQGLQVSDTAPFS
jgi:hypothetical protein